MSARLPAHRPFRFEVGARVRIDDRPVQGHCRTPSYLRGREGTIVAVHGVFHDPERLAYHLPGLPGQPLYKVRLAQSELWPGDPVVPTDTLEVDIYEPWLQPAAGDMV